MMLPPPPCLIICLAAIWVPKNALLRLTFSTKSYCFSVVSSTLVRVSTPALLTMMSNRPNRFTAVSTSICRSATLLTSASTPITWSSPSAASCFSNSSVASGCDT